MEQGDVGSERPDEEAEEMAYDLAIKNGRIVTSGSDFVGDIAVQGEQIAALGRDLPGRREIDAMGKLVLPGAIDGHVHMRTERPVMCYDETFSSGSVAAAFGGTTTFIDQVQAEYGRTLNQELDTRLEMARGQTAIDYGFHMNIREPIPARLNEIPSIVERGITSFKWYMAIERCRIPDDFLLRGMYEVAAHGCLSVVHAENQGVIRELARKREAEGRTAVKWFDTTYPSSTEGAAVTLALSMAELAGCRVLIFHNTCTEGVEAIRAAKARGVQAYGELGLAWAIFNSDLYRADPVSALPFLLTPPIRSENHRRRLWRGLAQGDLDIVSTDHTTMWLAPEETALGLAAQFGVHVPEAEIVPKKVDKNGRRLLPMLPPGGVELRLPMIYDHGVRGGVLDLHRWVEVCCSNPARIFDLHGKGHLLPGYDADIVVFDPEREVTISVDRLHSNTDYSVYEGMTMRGAVEKTFVRGKMIVDGAEFVGAQGGGRFIERHVVQSQV